MFGKALGNGYAITATIGRREVMEAAQSTFISSTFWTERIGPAAALKTLEVMERERSWEKITQIGETIRAGWSALAEKYRLEIEHFGLPSLAGFSFKSPKRLEFKTLVTQEMLKKSYLASNAVYACTAHTQEILSGYFDALDPVFAMVADCENGAIIEDMLEGPVCHAGFARLN
jgi:glutamate-1-semialdehyde 2,1-aminomutase